MYRSGDENEINMGEFLHYSKTLKKEGSRIRKDFSLNTILLYTFVNNIFIKK